MNENLKIINLAIDNNFSLYPADQIILKFFFSSEVNSKANFTTRELANKIGCIKALIRKSLVRLKALNIINTFKKERCCSYPHHFINQIEISKMAKSYINKQNAIKEMQTSSPPTISTLAIDNYSLFNKAEKLILKILVNIFNIDGKVMFTINELSYVAKLQIQPVYIALKTLQKCLLITILKEKKGRPKRIKSYVINQDKLDEIINLYLHTKKPEE